MSRKVFGVGVNDVPNITNTKGYTVWYSMLRRCYSKVYHKIKPSYALCEVHDSWKILSNFLVWFEDNYIEGWELDKDFLVKDNTLYSPATCVFIPRELNSLLIKHTGGHNGLPTGVSYKKSHGKFVAQLSKTLNGKRVGQHLLISESLEECEAAYNKAKVEYILEVANRYKDKLNTTLIKQIQNRFPK